MDAINRESPDGDESGAYICMHESEKTVQDTVTKRTEIINRSLYLVGNKRKVIVSRKVVLEILLSTNFVYSL